MTALQFEGKGFEYFKVWIVNILLIIVTLGLYYPWAKVRNTRYFYGNTTLENQNFEYHATGKQLFIGFLISFVLLIAYVGIQQISPEGSLIVILIFFLAFPWIIWRSLKFNMHVTSFSNVRFGFVGKLGGSYFNFMLMPILFFFAVYGLPILIFLVSSRSGLGASSIIIIIGVILALALAVYFYALMKKRNIHYILNGTRYGQGQFATDVQVKPFAIILLKTVGLFILAFLGLFLIAGGIAWFSGLGQQLIQMAPEMQNPQAMTAAFENPLIIAMIALIYISFIILMLGLYAYSYTRQRRYIYDNTLLDNKIAFKSTLGARKFAWISISNLLMVIFTLGLAMPWAKVRMARIMLENTHADTSIGFQGYVTAQQKVQSSLGEQIGDAFDVDVGIGL